MARRDALECVGDERARAASRLGAGLLLLLPNAARELVPDQVFRPLEQVALRLGDGQAGRLLQLRQRLVFGGLQFLLQLLGVRLAVGKALLPAVDLRALALEVVLRLA